MDRNDQHAASDAFLLPLPHSSSPPNTHLLSPTRSFSRKERRNPSVTPRRFGRFFTPRTSQPITGRRILADLASEHLNQQHLPLSPLLSDAISSDPIVPTSPSKTPRGHARKRSASGQSPSSPIVQRRGLILGDMQPPRLNLPARPEIFLSDADHLDECRKATLNRFFRTSRGQDSHSKDAKLIREALKGPTNKRQRLQPPEHHVPYPVRKLINRGFEAQLLDREHGFSCQSGRRSLATPACDARSHTANFYSDATDSEMTTSYELGAEATPFCQASFNRSPCTAIGDEQGFVRLFRTDGWTNSQNGKVESFFQAQDNAVIDIDVSDDDARLATACGDWSGRIFDMNAQTAVVDLKGHTSGMRQVRFQPGKVNGNVIATAAKDGCINIWDLRCAGLPVNAFSTADSPRRVTRRNVNMEIHDARPVNSMDLAHVRTVNKHQTPASITALQWFPPGREHLIASGSEASAAIKLWDIRCVKPRHKDQAVPLCVTAEPRHHTFRSYGLTSLALGGDATRLYSVCKDNTVYAYSTAHLILGQAPELVDSAVKRKPRGLQGPGPLYGWKNECLSGISFWVKCSLRRASHLGPEMLAVGGDKAPILFPTDENFMKTQFAKVAHHLAPDSTSSSSALSSTPGGPRGTPSSLTPSSANMPIFKCGTALINGHDKEVSTVSWTSAGRLVSLSDDGSVRHWQQGDDGGARARYLRRVGDFGGERWNCGWADVGDWDEGDEEEEEDEI